MKIIDTHQHLWDMEQFSYEWCKPIVPLNRTHSPEDYQSARRAAEAQNGVEIVASVHVEADVDEPHGLEETRWLSEVAATGRAPIRGLVAACRPESDDFEAQLDALQQFPLVRGLRRVLHTQPDALSQASLFSDNLNRLPQRGYSFDLCVLARQLPMALSLVERCPGVSFILDHCGVPDIAGDQSDRAAWESWRENIHRLAALENVTCKLSGLPAYAGGAWTNDDLRPYVEHVFEQFGANRVLWGSDWPVCTLAGTLSQWLEATLELTAEQSEENQRKLFYDNARRVYRLEGEL